MIVLFFLLSFESAVVVKTSEVIPVPDVIYEIESMAVTPDAFFLLDYRSKILIKIDKRGKLVAIRKGVGQGPGEFSVPISVTVGGGRVYVSDINKMHIFSEKDLSFLDSFKFFNNSPSMTFNGGELFLGVTKFPATAHGIYVFSPKGAVLRSFYEHKVTSDEYIETPFLEQDSKGYLYALHGSWYRVDILDRNGEKVREIEVKPSPKYREIVPYGPFQKKYGPNMSAYHNWRAAFSESRGIAVEKDRYLWLYFRDLQADLRTEHHFAEIYDLETGKKVVSWYALPGGLFDGGQYAYAVAELPGKKSGDYALQIVGLEVVH